MDDCRKLVKSDCEELLSRFQQTDSVRFEVFNKIWKDMKFSEIFYGLVKRKKRLFSHVILDTACRFFLPPFSFQIRVGGLYLLYSLYHSQTMTPPEKIRLALKDWEDVKKFEKDAVDAQHLDVIYILRQLMCHKAFHFTAMPTELSYRKKRKVERSVQCEQFMERASRPQELINIDLLEELSNINDHYDKLKTSVLSTSEQLSSTRLVRNDLVSQLRSTVVDFYKWQQRKHGVDDDDDTDEGGSSQQECSQRAELLASIKSKAFGQATEASKSRRHRQVEVDVTRDEPGPSHSSTYVRLSKPSLKARTNKNVKIAGDMWSDAAATTRISQLTALDFVPEGKLTLNKSVTSRRRRPSRPAP